jgi:hypothetical protein
MANDALTKHGLSSWATRERPLVEALEAPRDQEGVSTGRAHDPDTRRRREMSHLGRASTRAPRSGIDQVVDVLGRCWHDLPLLLNIQHAEPDMTASNSAVRGT